MQQRRVTRRDISLALASCTDATCEEGTKWRLDGGLDDDGEPLTLIAVIEGSVLVVTLW